jgi:hypothetical protein
MYVQYENLRRKAPEARRRPIPDLPAEAYSLRKTS